MPNFANGQIGALARAVDREKAQHRDRCAMDLMRDIAEEFAAAFGRGVRAGRLGAGLGLGEGGLAAVAVDRTRAGEDQRDQRRARPRVEYILRRDEVGAHIARRVGHRQAHPREPCQMHDHVGPGLSYGVCAHLTRVGQIERVEGKPPACERRRQVVYLESRWIVVVELVEPSTR